MLEIKTLGGLVLKVNDHVLTNLGSHKAEAILIYLAVRGGTCNRNILATLLWPDSPESQALTSLRVDLTVLRKYLGDYILVSRDSVAINPRSQVHLDVFDLESKLLKGDMDAVLDIYQGDFLQGFNIRDSLEFEDWCRLQQERINGKVTNILHSAISRAIETEEYKKGQFYVQRLLELDPLDEQAHRKCMLLFALDHQRARSLEQYAKCMEILRSE